jgi:hypothetical protein
MPSFAALISRHSMTSKTESRSAAAFLAHDPVPDLPVGRAPSSSQPIRSPGA